MLPEAIFKTQTPAVLLAVNAMKGSLTASEFTDALAEGLQMAGINCIEQLPLADGGDGTAKILAELLSAKYVSCKVCDPLMRAISAGYYITSEKKAIIEMADASGLRLLKKNEYNALKTSSFGTGQLISKALEAGASEIILCVGGSATVDAGMGALMALGVEFYSRKGKIANGNGAALGEVVSFNYDEAREKVKGTLVKLICDVKNSLLGSSGAAKVFAPQKGANTDMVGLLEKNMAHWADLLQQATGTDLLKLESGGAAGGIVASFKALFDVSIIDGASYVLEKSGFYKKAKQTDIIITGEGSIDESTLYGKLPGAVLEFGTIIEKPVVAVCGFNNLKNTNRFTDIISLAANKSEIQEAMTNTYSKMVDLGEKMGMKIMIKHKLDKAVKYFDDGKIDETLTLIDDVLLDDATNQEALMLKTKLLYKLQKWGDALNCVNRILDINPDNYVAKNYKQMITDIVKYWNKDLYNP
ncbi:MAG: glycerate kinase [Prolixibacteraceae bacterium]|jgi:glycerate kinase|nr:glycerate kinase [Prolixibacteraceae bacterium]